MLEARIRRKGRVAAEACCGSCRGSRNLRVAKPLTVQLVLNFDWNKTLLTSI